MNVLIGYCYEKYYMNENHDWDLAGNHHFIGYDILRLLGLPARFIWSRMSKTKSDCFSEDKGNSTVFIWR